MKFSLNLAQEFSNVDLKSIPREEILRRIGAQLGAVEDVTDWATKFEGAVIVRVVSCEKHPNADKLNVCRVDDGGQNQSVERGEDGLIQVVCGAPNVQAGMHAVWLAPGVMVPNSRDTDPFVLEAREIRGIVSNGMMASAHELGISEDHSGIVNVTAEDAGKDPVPGEPLTNYFGLDDFVIDCENKMFTHRPDCFGNLGIAREMAGIIGQKFESPSWYRDIEFTTPSSTLDYRTENEIEDLVPRFCVQVVEGVRVWPSPMWLQATLARVGIKPINNIVDLSNYYMHLTAQPTHAFDYDKLKAISGGDVPVLFPRRARVGEKLVLLGGKEIELHEDDIVIATDQKPVALAGIMGGAETEVDGNTKNILIEAATFDMYAIRRSSMRHGLFTDASARFNKGQSDQQNAKVLLKLVSDICRIAGGAAGVSKDLHFMSPIAPVTVSAEFVNQRLGSHLSAQEMKQLLENVECAVTLENDQLTIEQPFWRKDIEIAEDVVEEIGRLYGYDKLPVTLPLRSTKPAPKNAIFEFKQHLRYQLKEAGANEVLTYSFVHGDVIKKTGTNPESTAYHLRNAISPDLQYYRTSLVPSLLQKVHPNIKAQAGGTDNQFALFEIGKIHIKDVLDDEGLPLASQNLAFVVTADDKTSRATQAGAAYYLAKKYVDLLTNNQAEYVPLTDFEHPVYAHYAAGRAAGVVVNGTKIGVIGEFNQKVQKSFKLPAFTAAFELEIGQLMVELVDKKYEPLPPLPGTSQDYTHEVSSATKWQVVYDAFSEALNIVSDGHRLTIEPRDIFQSEDAATKHITFRVHMSHPDKTMTTDEATRIIEEAAGKLSELLA